MLESVDERALPVADTEALPVDIVAPVAVVDAAERTVELERRLYSAEASSLELEASTCPSWHYSQSQTASQTSETSDDRVRQRGSGS